MTSTNPTDPYAGARAVLASRRTAVEHEINELAVEAAELAARAVNDPAGFRRGGYAKQLATKANELERMVFELDKSHELAFLFGPLTS